MEPFQITFTKCTILERLLTDETDYWYLKSQPGYRAGTIWRLRAARMRAVRGYLTGLRSRGLEMYAAVKHHAINSDQDQREFLIRLAKQELLFRCLIAILRVQAHLQSFGIPVLTLGCVKARIEALRAVIRQFAAPATGTVTESRA